MFVGRRMAKSFMEYAFTNIVATHLDSALGWQHLTSYHLEGLRVFPLLERVIHRCKVLEFYSDSFWFVREHSHSIHLQKDT